MLSLIVTTKLEENKESPFSKSHKHGKFYMDHISVAGSPNNTEDAVPVQRGRDHVTHTMPKRRKSAEATKAHVFAQAPWWTKNANIVSSLDVDHLCLEAVHIISCVLLYPSPRT